MRNTLLVSQSLLVIASAMGFYWYSHGDIESVKAAVYGGMLALINGMLLVRSFRKSNEIAKENPDFAMKVIQLGALQRMILALVGLPVGMGVLELTPVAVLIAFAIAYLPFLFGIGKERSVIEMQ